MKRLPGPGQAQTTSLLGNIQQALRAGHAWLDDNGRVVWNSKAAKNIREHAGNIYGKNTRQLRERIGTHMEKRQASVGAGMRARKVLNRRTRRDIAEYRDSAAKTDHDRAWAGAAAGTTAVTGAGGYMIGRGSGEKRKEKRFAEGWDEASQQFAFASATSGGDDDLVYLNELLDNCVSGD
jgi:hypothetical protein